MLEFTGVNWEFPLNSLIIFSLVLSSLFVLARLVDRLLVRVGVVADNEFCEVETSCGAVGEIIVADPVVSPTSCISEHTRLSLFLKRFKKYDFARLVNKIQFKKITRD